MLASRPRAGPDPAMSALKSRCEAAANELKAHQQKLRPASSQSRALSDEGRREQRAKHTAQQAAREDELRDFSRNYEKQTIACARARARARRA